MKEWVLPLAGVGAEASILPEGEVFGEPMGDEGGVPEAESSAVTASSVEMMGAQVGQRDQTMPLLREVALPARLGVRVLSMKKSPSAAGRGAQRQAARPMRAIWPLQIKRSPHLRKECSPRSLLPPLRQELLFHQPRLVFLLPGVGESLLPEESLHAVAEGEDGPLHPFAQAGALPPSLWPPRSLQQVLCQVRNL